MNWTDVSHNWRALAPQIMTEWPHLDENEVLAIDGDHGRFIAYLASFDGMDARIAQAELDTWLAGKEPADTVMHPTRDNARISDAMENMPVYRDPLHDDDSFGDGETPQPPVGRS